MRAFDLATSQPWLITEPALRTILEIAARENLSPQAVAVQLGRPLDNTRTVELRDGVAIIPINGPIFRYANLFSDISGGTSVEVLAKDFRVALDNPQVRAILFEVDSPGGEVTGINELAQHIFEARGTKPLWAYVGGLGCSAAYWLASACDTIVCDATATLGSIGAVMTMRDPSKQTAREIDIVSSQSPRKRPDISTADGRAQVQARIDALADVFVAAIARNRAVSIPTVLADFGQGDVFIGQAAIVAGLADRLGSFEGTLADLAQGKLATAIRATTQEFPMANLKDMFRAMFSAMDEHEQAVPDGDGEAVAGELLTVDDTELAQALAAQQAENAALRAQLAERTTATIATAASAWSGLLVASGKALPAEQAQLTAWYTQAAHDDLARPLAEGSRTGQLTTTFDARPAHSLTRELVPVQATPAVITNEATTPAATAPVPISDERRAALLAQTQLGQKTAATGQ